MCRFIESIKIENRQVFLLELHQQRVDATFAHFGKENTLALRSILEHLTIETEELYKFRIIYDLENNFKTEITPYAFREVQSFELIESSQLNYTFKAENRSAFADLKSKSAADEIIILKDNCITDSSYANLIFLKDNQWFTPRSHLLNGVQRQNLLAKKEIIEIEISMENLKTFSHFQMINALNPPSNERIYPLEIIQNLSK